MATINPNKKDLTTIGVRQIAKDSLASYVSTVTFPHKLSDITTMAILEWIKRQEAKSDTL